MSGFRDKTFCASPNCQNECGRKMTDEERWELERLPEYCQIISQAYFCDIPPEYIESIKSNEAPE